MGYNEKLMAQLSIGIVGLPNVGKSTLFNALLKRTVADAQNYPFCTIEPNVGIIEVPDARLPKLRDLVHAQAILPAVVEFYDIAGLVRGASTGEGLGNKFLAHIREVAAIVHVVRLFDDNNIIHVDNKVDPAADILTIDSELALADLATLEKYKEPRGSAGKEDIARYAVVQKIRGPLNEGIAVRAQSLTSEELELLKPLNLLTVKPVIFAFNVSEEQLMNADAIKTQIEQVLQSTNYELANTNYIYLCAKLENDVLGLSDEDQQEYLEQFGLSETGLNRLVKESYKALRLMSYLTAGEKEVRAWTIPMGTLAPAAAGVIHTDFEKKFIKADVVKYQDFMDHGGWVGARAAGRVGIMGRDYVMEEDDIVEFKIGA